jgi:sarcosine oxidase
MRSLAAWKELFERAGRPGLFQHTGVLWTARRGHPHATGTLEAFRKLGVAHQELSAAEVRGRYPCLRFDHEAIGILEPESGGLLAAEAVRAVTREAARAGVEVVDALVAAPGEEAPLESISTDRGHRLAAANFVFACGPWLPRLFPRAVGRRIRVTRQPTFYFDATAAGLPIWIDFSDPRGGYTIPPLAGKGSKLALDRHGAEFDPDSGSRAVTAEETAAARAFLAERLPELAGAALIETEVCQYESTSSGDFLIDRHPTMANVWLVGGGSGHGFKHAPAVGEYLARRIDGEPGEARFSWAGKSETAARSVY